MSCVVFKIKCVALADEDVTKLTLSMSLKVRQLLIVCENNGCCFKQQWFHELSKVISESGLEWHWL